MSKIIKAETLSYCQSQTPLPCSVVDRPRPRASRAANSVVDAALIVQSARERAAAIIRSAQVEASRIVSEETERVVALREQAAHDGYKEGYARGYDEGAEVARREAEARLEEELRSLRAAVTQVRDLRARAVAACEADMVKFSVLIAERILRAELQDPRRTLDIARSILSEVRDESRICVYFPAELALSDGEIAGLAEDALPPGVELEVKSDPSLALGDIRVETAWGWIDGRAAIRWERLIEALKKGVDNHDDSA